MNDPPILNIFIPNKEFIALVIQLCYEKKKLTGKNVCSPTAMLHYFSFHQSQLQAMH